MRRSKIFSGLLLLAVATAVSGRAAEVIQIDVRPLLNARSVTTLTAGRLVTWTRGIDGGGLADGYLTKEAADFVGDKNVKALPGDGTFPATAAHPLVKLNYANADWKDPQTHCLSDAGEFSFEVPARPYQRLLLFMTSAEGASQLKITLAYADGSTAHQEKQQPDYYNAVPAGDPDFFALAEDLAKWDNVNHKTEDNHHFIHGLDLHPDAAKKLVRVRVEKTKPGYLVFWGATGVTE